MLRNTYFTKFQSFIRYGIILWGGEKESVKVFKIQKRVFHSIKERYKRESCKPIFKELKFLTVTALYICEVLIYIKKKHVFKKEFRHMSKTQEENVISMFQAVKHHSSRGV